MFDVLPNALRVHITVTPKSSRTAFKGEHDGRLKVLVQAPPLDGRANEAVIELFASVCEVPKRAVSIERGESSRQKVVLIATENSKKLKELLQKQL